MDMERLSNWKNRANQLEDGSAINEWKSLIQGLVDLYKDELSETLSGAPLNTARTNVQTATNTFLSALTANTHQVKKWRGNKMIYDLEAMLNAQTRIRNLNERSPWDAWRNALDAFIELLTATHLEAVSQEERQERRREIREAKARLLELLEDPQALYLQYVEARKSQWEKRTRKQWRPNPAQRSRGGIRVKELNAVIMALFEY
jgi:hypothetical protein